MYISVGRSCANPTLHIRVRFPRGVAQGTPPLSADGSSSASPRSKRGSQILPVLAVVLVIVVVGAAFVATDGFRLTRASSTDDLIPALSYFSLPAEQYNDVAFVAHSESVINGTFTNTLGVIVYLFTPAQIAALNHNDTVGSYAWSSGQIAGLSVYGLALTVQPGEWNLVFFNPNTAAVNTTVVGFYTAVTLKSA